MTASAFEPAALAGIRLKNRVIRSATYEGMADFVSMSRPFIIGPDIVSKFKQGRQTKSKCIKCNFCVIAIEQEPLTCRYGKLPKKKNERD